MSSGLTATQSAAAERIIRDVLAIASPGELVLVDANLKALRDRPEAYFASQKGEAELGGFGAADASPLLLPALLSLVSLVSSLTQGFTKKLGEELATWAAATLKNKAHPDDFPKMTRKASQALRKECLRRGCSEPQSKRAAEALEQVLRTSPELFATLAAGKRE